MKYFECDVPEGNGLCSDNACPCPEVVIPRGAGYLFIDQDLVDFRRQFPTLAGARVEMRRRQAEMRANLGGMFTGFYRLGPILVCEQGAKLRGLDLEIAAADARHWWETGQVPLRPTPLAGGKKEAESVTPEAFPVVDEEGLCWFCKKRPADHDYEVRLSRQNQVSLQSNQTIITASQTDKINVPIPRCAKCATIHQKAKKMRWVHVIIGSVVALAILVGVMSLTGAYLFANLDEAVAMIITGVFAALLMGLVLVGAEVATRMRLKKQHQDDFREGEIRLPTRLSLMRFGDVRKSISQGYTLLMDETAKANRRK